MPWVFKLIQAPDFNRFHNMLSDAFDAVDDRGAIPMVAFSHAVKENGATHYAAIVYGMGTGADEPQPPQDPEPNRNAR